jgi:hypothetical protein
MNVKNYNQFQIAIIQLIAYKRHIDNNSAAMEYISSGLAGYIADHKNHIIGINNENF